VTHLPALDRQGASDPEVRAKAATEDRILITTDTDFGTCWRSRRSSTQRARLASYGERAHRPRTRLLAGRLGARDDVLFRLMEECAADPLLARAHDTPEGFAKHMEMYRVQTLPAEIHFKTQFPEMVCDIDATQSEEDVFRDVLVCLRKFGLDTKDTLDTGSEI
jgi:adenylate kinase family enzyme